MSDVEISLSGELFHPDAAELLECLKDALDEGGCIVDVSELEKIEFGPLQVLVATAAAARSRQLGFEVRMSSENNTVLNALAAHALTPEMIAGSTSGSKELLG